MRPLNLTDKCYKFFPSCSSRISGPGSIVYEANKTYSNQKLFFFRKDEAISSIKLLLYFLDYGDSLAEVVVNQSLIDEAVEASPSHFMSKSISVGNIYNAKSSQMKHLILESLRKSTDFNITYFKDALYILIKYGAFDSAINVYETIKAEKYVSLSKFEEKMIVEHATQCWRDVISLKDLESCENMIEYINLLKTKIN